MIHDPAALIAIIAGITALSLWLDRHYDWAAKVGAGLLVIGFGAVVSNLGLVPLASPVYDAITGPVTSLAIVWLLFAVDLRDLKAAGPLMLAAFGIAVLATAIGAVVSAVIFADALGENAWKLGAAMTGTYSGGSLNFIAVGRAVGIPAHIFAAANASDAVMTAIWMGATIVLPVYIGKWYLRPVPVHEADEAGAPEAAGSGAKASGSGEDDEGVRGREGEGETVGRDVRNHPYFADAPLRIVDVAALITLAFALVLVSNQVAAWVPGIPAVLWLTTFALLVGHIPAVSRLSGSMQLGTLALIMFLTIIGIFSRIAEMLRVGPDIFYFTAVVVLIHGTLTYVGGRMARIDVGTTSVASQAAVGGPASAIALAVARDWPALALPGIVAGLLGYAMGNYVAFGVAWLLRALLGG